jgi:hypothetical protein
MENVMEMIFGNEFFQLPMLEGMAYIAGLLMAGAIIVGLSRRLIGSVSQSSQAIDTEEPFGGEWETRKAA